MNAGSSDEVLFDTIQRRTLSYFWDFSHPYSGMARERSNQVPGYDFFETVTTGGTGFGIMALLAGTSRRFLVRTDVLSRIDQIVDFLERCKSYHGVFPHFLHGRTGETIPFSTLDDGGDLVETSFLMMGLLCAREYFSDSAKTERALRGKIDALWRNVDWNWYTRDEKVLYWHWSPRHEWAMNHRITGWNECLLTYLLAAGSPASAISPDVYHSGWTDSPDFQNGQLYYGIQLPLGPALGGPLFFAHYSFLGLDPRNLRDRYADYWHQNRAHALINYAHCVTNPNQYVGYGPSCWGLTACDGDQGYNAFSPTNDFGVIAPTAALSSMPYTPDQSRAAARYFLEVLGSRIWTEHGFADSFNSSENWVAAGHLAIDQGPIVVMIENYRSGLLWRLFMGCPEVQIALQRLGFEFNTPRIETSAAL